jgi:hypothetical protein
MATQTHASLWTPKRKALLAGLLLLQLALAVVIGAGQLLASSAAAPIAPIVVTALVPVAAFLAAYGLSGRFRSFVLAQDLRTLTLMQHWRVVGFAFLPLYAFGVLPRLFAWPAGLGDLAIGLAALAVALRLGREPGFATSPSFVTFHLLGLFDFLVAIASANLASGQIPFLVSDGVTSAAMSVWPMNIFPSFLVPLFIILHLAALLQVRALRGGRASSAGAGLPGVAAS